MNKCLCFPILMAHYWPLPPPQVRCDMQVAWHSKTQSMQNTCMHALYLPTA